MNTTHKTVAHYPTNATLLAGIPAKCPECNSAAVAWSPLRVWCCSCNFQTAAQPNETSRDIIARWNRAVRDGEGYTDLLSQNIARRERERRERECNSTAELEADDSHLKHLRELFASSVELDDEDDYLPANA